VTEEADNGRFLSHSSYFFLGNSLPSFQEYAPRKQRWKWAWTVETQEDQILGGKTMMRKCNGWAEWEWWWW